MANELTFTISNMAFRKGLVNASVPTQAGSVTVSGTNCIRQTQTIGTTDEVLILGDVATNGYIFLHNLDPTNYITFGGDGTNYFNKLKAGESCIVRWNGAAIHAKANTGACLLEYFLVED